MNEKETKLTPSEASEGTVDTAEQTANVEVAEPAVDTQVVGVLPQKKKSNVWGTVFFVLSLALSLFLIYQLSRNATSEEELTFSQVFANVNVKYLLLAVGTLFVMMFLDSMKYFVIMRATTTKAKARYRTALTVALLGKYYDNITPFSSGGQPMQIYYLHKKGLGGGESSAVIFIKFAFNMTMWLTICCCLMAFNRSALTTYVTDPDQLKLFTVAGWIGFGVNCALPLLIVLCVVLPKVTWAITRGVLFIGHKLKIVKDKEATLERAQNAVRDFVTAYVSMLKRPLHTIILAILCICEPLLSMILPYFVVVALGGAAVTPSAELMFAIMTLNVYVSMSVTVAPTPGNSGLIETGFMLTLTNVASGVLFWTVFSWRFLSYYSYIIIGLIMTIVRFIRDYRRRRKAAL